MNHEVVQGVAKVLILYGYLTGLWLYGILATEADPRWESTARKGLEMRGDGFIYAGSIVDQWRPEDRWEVPNFSVSVSNYFVDCGLGVVGKMRAVKIARAVTGNFHYGNDLAKKWTREREEAHIRSPKYLEKSAEFMG